MALNPEFKAKWLEMLRSGEYEQTTNSLFNGIGYCCLGIACLAFGGKFEEDVYREQWPHSEEIQDMKLSGGSEYLSWQFSQKIGLSQTEENKLVCMNDDGSSFSDIADYIEKNL